jgi:aldehyde:ferredoxin oxidoreductase
MAINCCGNPIIKVNLTTGKIIKEIIDEGIRKKFLGGRGISDWLLYENVNPNETDPLSSSNVIIFGSGVLVGTRFPGAVRNSVVYLNALTKGYGESSSAGFFSLNMKRAGYDGIVIYGKSRKPVYLWINNEHVEIRDASHLIGKTTFETKEMIKRELKEENISACTIGIAGENLVRYALMNCDNRYCGRCGSGAVMGSKNLKAIAIKGTGSIKLFNSEKVNEISNRVNKILMSDPGRKATAKYGMGINVEEYNKFGLLKIKNYQEVGFQNIDAIGYNQIKKYYKGIIDCPFKCPVRCDRLVKIDEGSPYGGTVVSSLEATPAYNMAPFLIDDMPTIIKAFELCNALGIDMHSWCTVVQWAIECFERGILTREDTDKLELRWGDGPLLLELIRRIAYREGNFGDLLADGVAKASKKIGRGSEKYAMQIKGMEIDDELRVDKGMTLGILTEVRGPGHTLGAYLGGMDPSVTPIKALELYGNKDIANTYIWNGKPELLVLNEQYSAIQDCLGVCFFASLRAAPLIIKNYNMETYSEIIKAATGWNILEEELINIAERIITLEKSINILAGLERKDDFPPERFFEPIPDGPTKGMLLDRKSLSEALEKHSKLHGWNPYTSIPHRKTLRKLGLENVAHKIRTSKNIKKY